MIEVVAAAIFKEGRLLCFQRGDSGHDHTANKFEFPGGKIEPNETHTEALKREISEELNLEVSIGEWVATVEHNYPDVSVRLHCYVCFAETYDGTLNDHISYRSVGIAELEDVDWMEADIPIKDALKENFAHLFAN